MEQVRGKQVFHKLVVDGVSPFDTFVSGIEQQYESELDAIMNYMDQVANLKSVPSTKFHPYSDGKDGCREFEFKSKHLRVYSIECPNGEIVITGGTKANQSDDQITFRRLKNQFVEFQKSQKHEDKNRTFKK